MKIGIFIMAHAPLASALRQTVLHILPDAASNLVALDVQPDTPVENILVAARDVLRLPGTQQTLLLTDVIGATPCNVAQQLVDGHHTRLVAGVNLPMLLRTITYCHESLDALVERALAGGTQGVLQVIVAASSSQAA